MNVDVTLPRRAWHTAGEARMSQGESCFHRIHTTGDQSNGYQSVTWLGSWLAGRWVGKEGRPSTDSATNHHLTPTTHSVL